MTSPGHAVSVFLNSVTDWAIHQPTLSGVALVGSHARGEARPDSDIDLVLLCTPPNAFLDDISWVRLFGEVATCQTEEWGRVTSLRVSYRNGLEVEFGLTTPAWTRFPIDAGTRQVVSNGMRILLDKEGTLGRLLEAVLGV
jgi:predicted nucleotidyltransferase